MVECLLVGAGGFVGSVLRYLAGLIPVGAQGGFPVKTLCINVIGSFLIALIAALAVKHTGFDPRLSLMLRVGLCGGFTTFSTFAYESAELIKGGHWAAALCYALASVVLSVLAVFAAQIITK